MSKFSYIYIFTYYFNNPYYRLHVILHVILVVLLSAVTITPCSDQWPLNSDLQLQLEYLVDQVNLICKPRSTWPSNPYKFGPRAGLLEDKVKWGWPNVWAICVLEHISMFPLNSHLGFRDVFVPLSTFSVASHDMCVVLGKGGCSVGTHHFQKVWGQGAEKCGGTDPPTSPLPTALRALCI